MTGKRGLIGGFSLGIFEDILSGGLLGFNALLKGLIGHYTGGLKPNMTAHFVLFHCAVVLFRLGIQYFIFLSFSRKYLCPLSFRASLIG